MKKRIKVSLSNTKLFSGNMGKLIPIGLYEVIPGDTFQHAVNLFVRMAPLATPVMHPVRVRTWQFFVPFRLLWDSWEPFITGGEQGTDSNTIPKVLLAEADRPVGSLADYLGIPPGPTQYSFMAAPFQAYNEIVNKWFRDQDLQTERLNPRGNGDFNSTSLDVSLASVNWNKDRFTTARSEPQKGLPALIPLSEQLSPSVPATPLTQLRPKGIGITTGSTWDTGGSGNVTEPTGDVEDYADYQSTANTYIEEDPNDAGTPNVRIEMEDIGTLLEDIRYGAAVQRFRERMQRAGSRYVEYLKSSFGVKASDARLQNPELLASGMGSMQFSEVLQTSPNVDTGTSDAEGVGNMSGHGISLTRSNRYRRFFEEHGFVMTLMSMEPVAMYTEGLEKLWTKTFKEDFYDKDLALLGEEPVYNRELQSNHTDQAAVFGYQRRYYDYLTKLNSIGGEFRTTLDDWHMARKLPTDVALNSSFVTCDPTNRIYQATSAAQFYCRADHSVQVRRAVIPSRPGIL